MSGPDPGAPARETAAAAQRRYAADNTAVAERLEPGPSLALRNHSPSGFEWGYHGSGPAQLALALLIDASGDPEAAARHYQRFKRERVARWHGRVWALDPAELRAWLIEAAATPGGAVLIGLLLMFGGAWLLVVSLRAVVRDRPADRPPRPGEAGRAVLRAYRVVGDVRAIARGTYGRRLARRAVFRGIRRW